MTRHEQAVAAKRLPVPVAIFVLASMAALLGLAPGALAAKKYVPVGEIPNTNTTPRYIPTAVGGVAVSDKNHHIYLGDNYNSLGVYDFSSLSDTAPVQWSGSNTPAGSFGGKPAVAVDNATGDVYVADATHEVVDKLDENGNLITSFGDTEPTPNGQLAGHNTPGESFSTPGNPYSPTALAIAVDQSNHDLYVLDAGHQVVDVFDENGNYLRQITATPTGLYRSGGKYAAGIAVSSAGNVYVTDWGSPNLLFQFDSAGNYVSTWDGNLLPDGAASMTPNGNFSEECGECSLISVATIDSTGEVIIGLSRYMLLDTFTSSGDFVPPQATNSELEGHVGQVAALAVDQETGWLYVSGNNSTKALKPIIVPTISANAASNIGPTSATVSGHVDPATGEGGGPITGCHFEFIPNGEFNEQWKAARQAPCSPSPSSSPTDVSAELTGLTQGTEYRVRLVAENSEGTNRAEAPTFETVGSYGLTTQVGSVGSGDGQFQQPMDVAVDHVSGDIYVADSGNHRVVKLGPSGEFLAAWGWGVSNGEAKSEVCNSGCGEGIAGSAAGQFSTPTFVEVDNSSGPSAGDVYVGDTGDSLVQKFSPSGQLIESWGAGGTMSFGKIGTIGGIGVDPSGNLVALAGSFTENSQTHVWTEVSQDGTSVSTLPLFTGHNTGEAEPGGTGIDISRAGYFYEALTRGNHLGARYQVEGGEAAGVYPSFYSAPAMKNSGVAVDRSNSDVFVDQGNHIDQFTAVGRCPAAEQIEREACEPSDSFGAGVLNGAAGLAVQPASGALYVANANAGDIAIFEPLPAPAVTTGAALQTSPTEETLTGNVDPGAANESDTCAFEYVAGPFRDEIDNLIASAASGGTFTLTFGGMTTAPIAYKAGNENSSGGIQAALEALPSVGPRNVAVSFEGSQSYQIRFVGRLSEANLPQISADESGLTPLGAKLTPETVTNGNGWNAATRADCTPTAPISAPTAVNAQVSGLVPFTTYHYRLAATDAGGDGVPDYGREHTFTPNPGEPPTIDGASVSEVTPTTARLSASINPNFAPTSYRFQYGTAIAYGSQTPASESIGEDGVDHPAGFRLAGLEPGTTYHFRVTAVNFAGVTTGSDLTFNTPDTPAVSQVGVSGITQTRATLEAGIQPNFSPTTYRFDYGTSMLYGASVGGASGSDNSIHIASSTVTGLVPGTTYHFHVVATNAIGVTTGSDTTFTTLPEVTPGPGSLPKCRKGTVRRHGHCVRIRRHSHHHHRRHRRHATSMQRRRG